MIIRKQQQQQQVLTANAEKKEISRPLLAPEKRKEGRDTKNCRTCAKTRVLFV